MAADICEKNINPFFILRLSHGTERNVIPEEPFIVENRSVEL
jgi:hypothetical protein